MNLVFLVRSIGPTSMPWNDLYGIAVRSRPGLFYPPVVVNRHNSGRRGFSKGVCRGVNRRYINVGVFYALIILVRLARRRRMNRDILLVHVHNPSLSLVAVIAKSISPNIRIVGNLHNDWPHFNIFQRCSLWLLGFVSSAFVTVSEAIVMDIPDRLRSFLQKRGRLFSIRNGIPSEMLDYVYPLDMMQERLRDVVVVARMVPQKNVDMVLRVFSQLKNSHHLIWFSDGPLKERVIDLAEKYGIRDRLVLKGLRPREEVFDTLSRSSVYLACSRWEGIGVANMEAAAMGCFPFLSKIPPHEEIGGVLGIPTFSLESDQEWVEAIDAWLAQDEESRMKEAKRLAHEARRKFDLDETVDQYLDVYRSVYRKSNAG